MDLSLKSFAFSEPQHYIYWYFFKIHFLKILISRHYLAIYINMSINKSIKL